MSISTLHKGDNGDDDDNDDDNNNNNNNNNKVVKRLGNSNTKLLYWTWYIWIHPLPLSESVSLQSIIMASFHLLLVFQTEVFQQISSLKFCLHSPNPYISKTIFLLNTMGGACSTYGEEERRKPEGKRSLWRPRHRWEDNIKIDLQEVVCGTCTVSSGPRIGTGRGHLWMR